MLELTNGPRASFYDITPPSSGHDIAAPSSGHPAADRVRRIARKLGCASVWVRGAGPHVVLGLSGENAFARLSPIGGSSYGLAFRSTVAPDRRAPTTPSWEPLLLVDELQTVVEHALVGVSALHDEP
jgi:hypothetical protein